MIRLPDKHKAQPVTGLSSSRNRQRQLFGAPAIDEVDLTGHEGALFRGKPNGKVSDIGRLTKTSNRMHGEQFPADTRTVGHAVDVDLTEVRIDPARRNSIAPNALVPWSTATAAVKP